MSTFALDVSRICQATGLKLDLVVKKVVFDLYASITLKTPVDTGFARANWMVGVNAIPQGLRTSTRPKAGQVLGAPPQPGVAIKAGGIVYIANNVAYIEALEDGHSTQAPMGMVKLSVLELQNHFDRIVGEVAR